MPYDEPDAEDPSMLVGVVLPGDKDSVREMAAAFADEFAAMGFDERRLLALFRSPCYAGMHRAMQVLGEGVVRDLIRESVAFWGRLRVSVEGAEPLCNSQDETEEEPCRKS